jgi:hypothetical protein
MATTIVDELRWYGPGKKGYPEQTIPTTEQLLAAGAEETGDTIESYSGYDPQKDALPEGRDSRTYSIDSPGRQTYVTYIPDAHGFYVENMKGTKWRPKDLDELETLLDEMDHQISRYGSLLS